MKTVNFTEFRNHASELLDDVEHGESLIVMRHGHAIAEVTPCVPPIPAWKRPAVRLSGKKSLSVAIIEEREHESLS